MSIEVTRKDIDTNIEIIYNNLKGIQYTPLDVELTTEERATLFNEFYTYGDFDSKKERLVSGLYNFFIDLSKDEESEDRYVKITPENLAEINMRVVAQLSDEAKRIIAKCGISLSELYSLEYWNKHYTTRLNPRLLGIMHNNSIAEIGDYVVERTQQHPIARDSETITSFFEEYQEEKYNIAKDCEKYYTIKRKGETEPLYRHDEGIVFGGYISAGRTQIGGNFALGSYRFDIETGMMYKDGNIAREICEIMAIFEEVIANVTPEVQARLSEESVSFGK